MIATRLPLFTLAAILATLVVNTLSNFFPPGGQNVGEISNTVLSGVLITPANYAFAIWGLIYIGLIAYGVYQLRPHPRKSAMIQRASQLLIIACLAQVVWIFLFTLQWFWASVGVMLLILLPLIGAYWALHDPQQGRPSRQRQWYAQIPFSIYLGWISIATVVNVAAALYASNWNGFGLSDAGWTVVMIVIAAAIAAVVALQRGDVAFVLVFVWALSAIAVRHADQPMIWMAAIAATIGMLGLLIGRRFLT